jgi:hypothetical protein
VSGLVADVTGSTAQVQSTTSQTAVTWTKGTTFTEQAATSAAHLRVGDCVMARAARPANAGTPGSTATGTPAPTATTGAGDSTVAAETVEIVPTTGGSCTAGALGGGFGFGGAGNRTGGTRPPTATNGAGGAGTATGGPGAGGQDRTQGFRGQGRAAVGTVTALQNGSFTVAPIAGRGPSGATAANTAPVTVTYTPSTTFTTLEKAAASAVRVGVCLTAFGKTDDTGAVTATAVQVSPPVGGTCTTGFRQGGAGRPGATATGTGNA